MRILLIGEYSNVHWTLAQGLRTLGHDVLVVSDGDSWKNYQRDIDISRRSTNIFDTLQYLRLLKKTFRKFKGFDVVQIINPMFLELRAHRILPYYKFLRENNDKLFMGAYGMDYYWVKTCLDCKTFKYSDFNFGDKPRIEESYNKQYIAEWTKGEKAELNQFIAHDCDGIIAGLYEYSRCYKPLFPEKTTFIPFPIDTHTIREHAPRKKNVPLKLFIGIQKNRSAYKGTDIMLNALQRVKKEYPDRCEVIKVESVPFTEYKKLVESSDCILDQLYSYTPGMNGLLAMSKGVILIGGGEEEHYESLNEMTLRPIINVLPDENDVYEKIKGLVLHPELIDSLSKQSTEYVRKHHDYINVARQYVNFWNSHGQSKS